MTEPHRNDLQNRKKTGAPFPFARMARKRNALDRLDLQFRWGRYGIRVLRCHLMAFEPGQVIGFHKHSEFEFHFIPKGKGTVTIQDRKYELGEGLFYLTGPDVIHEQRSDDEDPMFELCLHCEIVELDRAAEAEWGDKLEEREAEECVRLLQTMPPEPALDRYQAMNCFLDAYRAWEEQPVGFYTTMKQTVLQILLRAARVHAAPGDSGNIPERDMKDHRFRLATQFIEDNEARPLTLEDVAEKVRVSPRQLQRIFRSEGNSTFHDWLEHARLQKICSELLQTDRPIEDIALDHGYSTPNYLYPVFKKKYGMTPSAYRRHHGVR
ncbi:helix-turn-helix domain-containing protein [Cohnella faecalis]|uniref:AraC family transcriptional regulator n=1 Tax=Cohnella faecalis TaxID=2315694 RepID=A0A398CJF3_9BACL|nr:AraC family transcriptional regulator [Cohnella faecalis]RIE02262.1 AraC family transcriptional regulator [Cohnella faecalis]